MANLSTSTMLVTLNVSVWTATKLDRKATAEVTTNHGAAHDAGRFNKQLIDKSALAPINTIVTAARQEFYANTLPWTDQGQRLLRNSRYLELQQKMDQSRSAFEAAVRTFLDEYEQHRERARLRLNSLFDANEYPDRDAVADKFRFVFRVQPVPTAGDFRVELNQQDVARIQRQIEEQMSEQLDEAMRSVLAETLTTVSHVADRLTGEGRLFSSVFSNVDDLVERLPHLNVTDDPQLAAFTKELRDNLTGINAKDVKDDPVARSAIAQQAADIANRMRFAFKM